MSISPIVRNTHSIIIAIKNKNPMGILLSIKLVYELLTNKLLEASDGQVTDINNERITES